MPKVEFKRVETDEEVENINIKDGQLIYSKTGKTFMDYGNERIPTGSGGSSVNVDTEMSDTSENAVQNKVIKEYVDDQIDSIPEEVIVSDTQPTSTGNKIWIDTGEVGSAVSEITNEYSTSTGLGYSANYVNNLHTYSTDEIRVGTWLGKPLYRKVIQTTIPTSGNNQNVSFQNNVAIMKSVTGFALQSASGGVNLILPYISITNSWSIYAYYNRVNQELIIENSGTSFMNNTTCYLIAEYTKTTD